MTLRDGERVHLIDRKGRVYPLTLRAGKIHQHSGQTIAHDRLIGAEDGSTVTLSAGATFVVLRPTLAEFIMKMPRGAQVIYPKDLATILLWADIYPGATVVEAGIGSGALTMTLLRAVGEAGRVVSYEIRDDFAERALENIAMYLGKVGHHVLRRTDIALEIEEREVDRLVLDLPEPWRVVPEAIKALRHGGIFLSYLPTVPQVARVVEALEGSGAFGLIETFETLQRPWNIEGRSVRPALRMVAHTAFLTVARKLATPVKLESGIEEEKTEKA
jgi:tRNA (adenine57-N1/adenine58-N1)-methyltransferase